MYVNTDILRESVVLRLLTGWHSPLFSTLPAEGTESELSSFASGEQGNPGTYRLLGREHSDGVDSLQRSSLTVDCHAGQIAFVYKKSKIAVSCPHPVPTSFLAMC